MPLCLFSLSVSFYDLKQYQAIERNSTPCTVVVVVLVTIVSGGYYTYYCVDVCDIPPENRLIVSEKVLSQKRET